MSFEVTLYCDGGCRHSFVTGLKEHLLSTALKSATECAKARGWDNWLCAECAAKANDTSTHDSPSGTAMSYG